MTVDSLLLTYFTYQNHSGSDDNKSNKYMRHCNSCLRQSHNTVGVTVRFKMESWSIKK